MQSNALSNDSHLINLLQYLYWINAIHCEDLTFFPVAICKRNYRLERD